MTLDQQFNQLNDKLQLLLRQYNRLQKENEKLKAELQQAAEKDRLQLEKMAALEQQVDILRLSQGSFSEKDKKEFEKKINQYLREIDRCISYLSQ